MNIPTIPDEYDPPIRQSIRDVIAAFGGNAGAAWALIVKVTGNFVPPEIAEATAMELVRQVTTEEPTKGTKDTKEPAAAPPATGAPGSTPPATAEPMLRSVAWAGFPKIKFDAPITDTWPKEGPKNIVGVLCLNRSKCEHVAANRGWSSVVNAVTPGKYYRPELKSGMTVMVSIRSNNGKIETNQLPIRWP